MMTPRTANQSPSWRRTIQFGAATGVSLTIAYASLFAFYAVCRSSLTIAAVMPLDSALFGTLAANATAIGLASTVTALALSPLTAVLGLGNALLFRWLDAKFNQRHDLLRTLLIGLATSLALVLAFQLGGQWLLGRSLNSLGAETYLFWFGLPGLLHIAAALIGAWYFHHSYAAQHPHRTEIHYGSHNAYT